MLGIPEEGYSRNVH